MKRIFSIVLSLLKIVGLFVFLVLFLSAGQSIAGIFEDKSIILFDLIDILVFALFCISLLWLIKIAYKFTPQQLGVASANFKQNIKKFLKGGILGIVLFVIIAFSLYAIGITDIDINKGVSVFALLYSALISLFVGFYEEVIFRGFIYNEFSKYNFRFNTVVIILISGVTFALAHTGNGGFSVLVGVNAVLFSAINMIIYKSTNNLWIPIGIHAFWNFFEGNIFGAYVSGNAPENSILISKLSGDQWLTGGTFGVEGSVISTVFYIIILVAIIFYFNGKKNTLSTFKSQ